LKEFLK